MEYSSAATTYSSSLLLLRNWVDFAVASDRNKWLEPRFVRASSAECLSDQMLLILRRRILQRCKLTLIHSSAAASLFPQTTPSHRCILVFKSTLGSDHQLAHAFIAGADERSNVCEEDVSNLDVESVLMYLRAATYAQRARIHCAAPACLERPSAFETIPPRKHPQA